MWRTTSFWSKVSINANKWWRPFPTSDLFIETAARHAMCDPETVVAKTHVARLHLMLRVARCLVCARPPRLARALLRTNPTTPRRPTNTRVTNPAQCASFHAAHVAECSSGAALHFGQAVLRQSISPLCPECNANREANADPLASTPSPPCGPSQRELKHNTKRCRDTQYAQQILAFWHASRVERPLR